MLPLKERTDFCLKEPGQRETCLGYNALISCEAGSCKNISDVWACTYKDR